MPQSQTTDQPSAPLGGNTELGYPHNSKKTIKEKQLPLCLPQQDYYKIRGININPQHTLQEKKPPNIQLTTTKLPYWSGQHPRPSGVGACLNIYQPKGLIGHIHFVSFLHNMT